MLIGSLLLLISGKGGLKKHWTCISCISQRAQRSANIFRFIHDGTAINDSGLKLKKQTNKKSGKEGSFLDLFINIEGNKFSMNLFDKTTFSRRSNARRPHVTSNIPSKIFYGHTGQNFQTSQ